MSCCGGSEEDDYGAGPANNVTTAPLRRPPYGVISRFNAKHEHFVELLGYCLEGNNRILVYQYATMGSIQDVLRARLHSTRVLGTFGYHAPEADNSKKWRLQFWSCSSRTLSGRKPVDHTMPRGQQSLVTWLCLFVGCLFVLLLYISF